MVERMLERVGERRMKRVKETGKDEDRERGRAKNTKRQIFPFCVHLAATHSFIHSVFCLTTGPKPPPKRFLHIVRSRASSFN
jgi:hypothetical protein